MAAFDAKAHLRKATETGAKFIANNINAIPEDKRNEVPAGKAQSPLYIVAEAANVNGFVARVLKGEAGERPSSEETDAYLKSFDTMEKALAFLTKETDSLLAAIDALDESTLGDLMQTPVGERTRFAFAEIPMWHMSYHDGQLNYIQTMLGDEEMHWN